ncbi:hypothetical protein E2562_025952 [Oryza meyeriana var. granulata]|uniref:Uncharacterized protein n=1 Tax=Oryza meyeriana var. granulata TaxID=110450 RepID=A0A6G1EYU4_9ORYZ|nr:hypothetical protein E2562_025952 [Oryza meyeriana var. granulata]
MSARHSRRGEHHGKEAATGEVGRLTRMCRATAAAGVFPSSYLRALAGGCLARSVWVGAGGEGRKPGSGRDKPCVARNCR